jgi:hypothetical protein
MCGFQHNGESDSQSVVNLPLEDEVCIDNRRDVNCNNENTSHEGCQWCERAKNAQCACSFVKNRKMRVDRDCIICRCPTTIFLQKSSCCQTDFESFCHRPWQCNTCTIPCLIYNNSLGWCPSGSVHKQCWLNWASNKDHKNWQCVDMKEKEISYLKLCETVGNGQLDLNSHARFCFPTMGKISEQVRLDLSIICKNDITARRRQFILTSTSYRQQIKKTFKWKRLQAEFESIAYSQAIKKQAFDRAISKGKKEKLYRSLVWSRALSKPKQRDDTHILLTTPKKLMMYKELYKH